MTEKPPQLKQMIEMIRTQFTDDDALQRLTEAVILGARLEELSDDLVDHFVNEARDLGSSWNEIGEAMGITRQAAQKRFVGNRGGRGRTWSLFTRFGEGPREVVLRSVAIAQSAGDNHVGTEHLVLGLTTDPHGLTARAIHDLGADVAAVRDAAGAGQRTGSGPLRRSHLPFAPDAKKTLELALREAIRSESRSIDEQHIVLAILRNKGCPGERALVENGVGRDEFEAWCEENAA